MSSSCASCCFSLLAWVFVLLLLLLLLLWFPWFTLLLPLVLLLLLPCCGVGGRRLCRTLSRVYILRATWEEDVRRAPQLLPASVEAFSQANKPTAGPTVMSRWSTMSIAWLSASLLTCLPSRSRASQDWRRPKKSLEKSEKSLRNERQMPRIPGVVPRVSLRLCTNAGLVQGSLWICWRRRARCRARNR